MTGRFAPSPTGRLHVGNLRTALAAWLFARSAGERFLVRMEDLDRVTARVEHEAQQLRDLAAIGLDWDGEVVRQSERFARYFDAIADLRARGLTYECFCTRREIREAAAAPHEALLGGAYPGTCRALSAAELSDRRRAGRPPALRLRAESIRLTFADRLCGQTTATVDDFVLQRNDGVPSYNVAVVVDDAAQGVSEVVRADDLLYATPRQLFLCRILGLAEPSYAHVPLVLGPDGERLAKRHGAISLADLATAGRGPDDIRRLLAASLGFGPEQARLAPYDLAARFDPGAIGREPWVFSPELAPPPRRQPG